MVRRCKYKQPNLCWSNVRDNKRDVKQGVIKSRVLTGTYKIERIISRYEKSTTSSLCRQKDTEDYVHFLLKCDTLSTIRNNHLVRLALYLEKIQVNTDYLVNSEKDLLQLIIDCSASNLIDSQYRKDVDTICRDMIYALHVKRVNYS